MKQYLKLIFPFTSKQECEEKYALFTIERSKYPDPILLNTDNRKYSIWIDKSCVASLIHEEGENSSGGIVYEIFKSINFDVEYNTESDFPWQLINGEILYSKDLIDSLNNSVLIFNRFVKFLKFEKHQYWLEFFSEDKLFTQLSAQISSDRINWTNIEYQTKLSCNIALNEESKYVNASEFSRIAEFIGNDHRIRFKNELLSNIEYLIEIKQYRNAVVDLYIVLESVLYKFCSDIDISIIEKDECLKNIDISNLTHLLKKIGVSSFISLILPVIIGNQYIKKEDYKKVFEFITLRQNIVHNVKRISDPEKTRSYFNVIKLLIGSIDSVIKK